jgi:hypothetical protein
MVETTNQLLFIFSSNWRNGFISWHVGYETNSNDRGLKPATSQSEHLGRLGIALDTYEKRVTLSMGLPGNSEDCNPSDDK